MLDPREVRVLGSLIEKEMSTPEYYPMTLNSLTNACNQKNNRDPVVAFEDKDVVRALDGLRDKQFVSNVTGAGMRVPKYRQTFTTQLQLIPPEAAVLCVLLLRGPQTIGELRTRSAPMHQFENLQAVELVLDGLSKREPWALTMKLPRQMGQKEVRFTHLFSGTPTLDQTSAAEAHAEPATLAVRAENERIAKLEEEVKSMKSEIAKLQKQLLDFKRQFE